MTSSRPRTAIFTAVWDWISARKIVRAVMLYIKRNGPTLADSVAYRTLFSVFAAVLLGFSVLAIWLAGDTTAWNAIVAAVNGAIPGLISPNGLIKPDSLTAPITFQLTGAASLVGLIAAALGAISSLRVAIRTLAGTHDDDVFWVWVVLRNLALALGIGAAVGIAAWLTFSGRLGVTWATDFFVIPKSSPTAQGAFRSVSIVVTFILDIVIIAGSFLVLSGRKVPVRAMIPGLLIGAIGMVVLQELSGYFVGGAAANPLLASFASLLALLVWFHLSVQVILVGIAYIIVGATDAENTTDAVRAMRTHQARAMSHPTAKEP